MVRPSGLNATAATGPPCPPKVLWIRWPSRASQTRIDVGRESGDEGPAIRAPGQLQDRARGALEAEGGQARVDGVEHQARVGARPGEAAAVGAEGEGTDAAGQIRDAGPRS